MLSACGAGNEVAVLAGTPLPASLLRPSSPRGSQSATRAPYRSSPGPSAAEGLTISKNQVGQGGEVELGVFLQEVVGQGTQQGHAAAVLVGQGQGDLADIFGAEVLRQLQGLEKKHVGMSGGGRQGAVDEGGEVSLAQVSLVEVVLAQNGGILAQNEVVLTQNMGILAQKEGIPAQNEVVLAQNEGIPAQNKGFWNKIRGFWHKIRDSGTKLCGSNTK